MNPRSLSPFLCVLSLVVPCMEVDISVPSFPQIATFFSVTEGLVQLTIAYNFLGFCVGAFLYGPLSECYGRRLMMLWGNGLLALGALGCFLTPSMDVLLLCRFIQGVGASTSAVLIFAMIADVYEGHKAFKLIGLMNACLALFMAMAPIAGGVINTALGWRGNYGFVWVMSLVSWLMLYGLLPETLKSRQRPLISLILQDYRTLFKSMTFMGASLAPSLFFAAYMVFISASPFLYMQTFQLSLLQFVCFQVMIVASFSLTSLIADKLIQRWGGALTVRIGTLISTFGFLSALYLGFSNLNDPFWVSLMISILCIGWALFYPVIFGGSLGLFPRIRGTASSMIMSIRALLVFSFTSSLGTLYDGTVLTVLLTMAGGIFPGVFCIYFLLHQNKLPSFNI